MATISKLSTTLARQERRASGLGTNVSLHKGLGVAEREMYGKKVIRRIFDDIDINNDGSLDRHEFVAALEQLGIYLSRRIFDRLMRVIDVDQSETVDYYEFIALVRHAPRYCVGTLLDVCTLLDRYTTMIAPFLMLFVPSACTSMERGLITSAMLHALFCKTCTMFSELSTRKAPASSPRKSSGMH
jgi:hypothetical protein